MPPSTKPFPVEWVSPAIIRRYFNESQILEKAQSGELFVRVIRSSHPRKPPPTEPVCTKSQMVLYRTLDGKPVALAHRYLRRDGTIGASGRPDPKRLFLEDRIISVHSGK